MTGSVDFNFDWKFMRGDNPGAYEPGFDDSGWEEIRLPHDWSILEDFTTTEGAGPTAFLPGGIGWYRKTFRLPEAQKGLVAWIEFDGVYNNSTVWLNGHKLGDRPYGYAPFSYDLTDYLKDGNEANVIAVRVDRSAFIDSRWYPGSGIYRNVRMVTKRPVHIPQWGTVIRTPLVLPEKAEVKLTTTVRNQTGDAARVGISVRITDPDGRLTAELQGTLEIESGGTGKFEDLLEIEGPRLWHPDHPHLYTADIRVMRAGKTLDWEKVVFGLRTIRFDPEEGFFLNGKTTEIRGVNLHHDGGLVGAAVPDGVWERRLKLLKEAGCNAIRTAHNPPSEAFLDLCDRIGFLVQDEAFDEWNNPKDKRNNFNQEKAEKVTRGYTHHFDEWAERDIKAMVRRDRNHPCIIMWSIGNEIEWTYPRYGAATGYWGSSRVRPDINYYWDEPPLPVDEMKRRFNSADSGRYQLAPTARKLADWIREEDLTRPVTANLVIPSVGHWSGYTDALDIVGYSYRQVVYDYGHRLYPDKMILGTENFPRWHEWKYASERPFIPGIFIWKGVGYLGEARNFPDHGGGSGLLNLAGFRNPAYHHFKSFWTDEHCLYRTTQTVDKSTYKKDPVSGSVVEKEPDWWKRQKWGWQDVNEYWDYPSGEEIAVEAYTNCDRVELFLNGEPAGTQILGECEDRILKWIIPFREGTLTARGTMADGTIVEEEIRTTGGPSAVEIMVDKESLKADHYDVVHVVAHLVNLEGRPVKHEERRIRFKVEGDCRILGMDNGSSTNVEGFQSDEVMTYRGKCLLILQSNGVADEIRITASSAGLESETVNLRIR
jgi:hypothetical protein